MLTQEALVRDLVRLRRAVRRRHDDDLVSVQADLARAAGPTVRRAAAARLLGVSQTAFDRWIERGDLPVVVTPDGRRAVPTAALVELAERVEDRRRRGERDALAQELRARRQRATALDVTGLLPRGVHADGPHRAAELRALAYHRAVARLLDDELVADARDRIRRWREERRIHPRYADHWETLLERPRDAIARELGADEPHLRDLRQSSPFAGTLDEATRRRVLDAVAKVVA
ncbi:MerR family transcriptional regulator [Conexibacter woesei]|uniref:hypothetical protein n=1 Tax=Conexibacter woesei TaxID=191495 RepID=UPI000674FC37|nr:hypothetical protein [Conexibacter woesei]